MNVIGRNKAQRIAMQAAKNLGLDPKQARPHELMLFAKLSTSKDSYTLSLDQDAQQKVLSIAEGLEDKDAFVAIAYAMGILSVPVISSTEYPGAAVPIYHADPNVLSTAATADLSEAQQVNHLYWGRHTLQTNEGIRINRATNLHFMTIQDTQASATTRNMNTGLELKEIGAAVRFAGGDRNSITIEFDCDDKSLMGGPATRNNYILFRLVGAIVKGGTSKTFLG